MAYSIFALSKHVLNFALLGVLHKEFTYQPYVCCDQNPKGNSDVNEVSFLPNVVSMFKLEEH